MRLALKELRLSETSMIELEIVKYLREKALSQVIDRVLIIPLFSMVFEIIDIRQPVITQSPSKEIYESETIYLRCNSDSYPTVQYIWMKDNRVIATSSLLQINNILRNDTGLYQCVASNRAGKLTQMKKIDVLCKYLPIR